MNDPNKGLRIAHWVIWVAILQGLLVLYFLFAKPGADAAPGAAMPDPLWPLALIPLAISCALRWLVIPRTISLQSCLTVFIVGLALAEATSIIGLFVFPGQKEALFMSGVLGVLQYVPIFVYRHLD